MLLVTSYFGFFASQLSSQSFSILRWRRRAGAARSCIGSSANAAAWPSQYADAVSARPLSCIESILQCQLGFLK